MWRLQSVQRVGLAADELLPLLARLIAYVVGLDPQLQDSLIEKYGLPKVRRPSLLSSWCFLPVAQVLDIHGAHLR